ncbi:hypothetical protein ACTFSJ_27620 [Bacillus cereus group sp. MYBK12-2]|uniref:hypothetical protein n=1 Tax=Bacillus cereus group sp. MYBK12-2 TaxID=3450689 RepID=UPI0032FA8698|nr:hypothetical protein [Bacillus pacificus]HDR7653554.1 hypothetical protein [Bacillus pacificus]
MRLTKENEQLLDRIKDAAARKDQEELQQIAESPEFEEMRNNAWQTVKSALAAIGRVFQQVAAVIKEKVERITPMLKTLSPQIQEQEQKDRINRKRVMKLTVKKQKSQAKNWGKWKKKGR